jgi:hypothetical protein
MLKPPRRDRLGNRFWIPSFCPNRNNKGADNMPNRAQQIYKQEFRFGLGGVSLGNEFNKHTDKDAEGALEAAWEVGVRYFDVAPWYGFGLAERRFGHFLHNKKREETPIDRKREFSWIRPETFGNSGPTNSNMGLQRLFGGPFSSKEGNSLKRGLPGWGGRNRTADWRKSLKCRSPHCQGFTDNAALLSNSRALRRTNGNRALLKRNIFFARLNPSRRLP